jgi:hypothetical protein
MGPTAMQSKLGYLLSGPTEIKHIYTNVTNVFHVSTRAEESDISCIIQLQRSPPPLLSRLFTIAAVARPLPHLVLMIAWRHVHHPCQRLAPYSCVFEATL